MNSTFGSSTKRIKNSRSRSKERYLPADSEPNTLSILPITVEIRQQTQLATLMKSKKNQFKRNADINRTMASIEKSRAETNSLYKIDTQNLNS